MIDHTQFLWNVLVSDTDFGPDGALYMSDWVHGWPKSERGRIYRLYQPDLFKSDMVLQTKKLIGEGMEKRSAEELQRLLQHTDMRVRQEAQFELAGGQVSMWLSTFGVEKVTKVSGQMEPVEQGWYSERFGAKEANTVLEFGAGGVGAVCFGYVVSKNSMVTVENLEQGLKLRGAGWDQTVSVPEFDWSHRS